MRVTILLAALAAGALLSGCEPGNEDAANPPPSIARCPGGAVSPVQVDDLVRVFRQHGLTMFDDPACAISSTERQASNLPIWGPDSNGLDREAINEHQGHVFCLFDATALDEPVLPVVENKYPTDQETSFSFGNVMCLIYPASDESEKDQLGRLRTASNALAREFATPKNRVESDIEARLGLLTKAECAGAGDRWLCDISDEATQREYSGCDVRLNDAGRIISSVEECRPE